MVHRSDDFVEIAFRVELEKRADALRDVFRADNGDALVALGNCVVGGQDDIQAAGEAGLGDLDPGAQRDEKQILKDQLLRLQANFKNNSSLSLVKQLQYFSQNKRYSIYVKTADGSSVKAEGLLFRKDDL